MGLPAPGRLSKAPCSIATRICPSIQGSQLVPGGLRSTTVHRSPRQNDTRLFWPTIKLLPTPARAALNRGRSIARDRERPPARVRLARPPSLGAPQPDAPEAAGAADAENAMEPPRTL